MPFQYRSRPSRLVKSFFQHTQLSQQMLARRRSYPRVMRQPALFIACSPYEINWLKVDPSGRNDLEVIGLCLQRLVVEVGQAQAHPAVQVVNRRPPPDNANDLARLVTRQGAGLGDQLSDHSVELTSVLLVRDDIRRQTICGSENSHTVL